MELGNLHVPRDLKGYQLPSHAKLQICILEEILPIPFFEC